MSSPDFWTSSNSLKEQEGRVLVDEGLHDWDEVDIQRLNLMVMEQPLRTSGSRHLIGQMSNTSGTVFKHEYILLQIENSKWIKAEKGAESEPGNDDAGITVKLVKNLKDPSKDLKGINCSSIRFETNAIHLSEGKQKWILKPLIKLLTNRNPNYNILTANCWEHSFSSADAILLWSIENALSQEVKDALTTKLAELRILERPMPADVCGRWWIDLLPRAKRPEGSSTRNCLIRKRDCPVSPSLGDQL